MRTKRWGLSLICAIVLGSTVLASIVLAWQDPEERPNRRRTRKPPATDDAPADDFENRPAGPGGPGGPAAFLRMFPLMAVLDADENGEISNKEIKRAASALRTLDADENGTLTEDELRPAPPRFGGPGGNPGFGGPGNGAPPGGGPGGPRGRFGPEAFVNRAMQFDEDGDGKLSREELTRLASQMGRPPGGDGNPGPGGQRPNETPDSN